MLDGALGVLNTAVLTMLTAWSVPSVRVIVHVAPAVVSCVVVGPSP